MLKNKLQNIEKKKEKRGKKTTFLRRKFVNL